MRNSLLGVLVLLCSVTAVMAQPAERAATTFEEALLAKSRTMQTIFCRFEQTQSLAVLAREVTKPGRFYYVQPDRLALLFDDGDYIRMDATAFAMKSGTVETKRKIATNPMLKQLRRLLAGCMSGDLSLLTADYSCQVEAEEGLWLVTLRPLRNRAAAHVSRIVMRFDAEDLLLDELRMEQPTGDFTRYRFYEKRINEPFDGALLEWRE